MKLECSAESIKEVVTQVEKIVSKNSTLEVLNSVLITAKGKSLTFKATNLSLGIEVEIPANIEKEGEIAILGSVLYNSIVNLSNNKIITLTQKDNNLVISNKNSSVTLKSVPKEDFPTLPAVEGDSFEISSTELLEGIKAVYYSSSVSDIKPEISSVYFYTNENKIYFVSTDSFRLAEKNIENKKEADISSILVPYKNILEILKVLSSLNDDIKVTYNKNQISFQSSGLFLTSRLVDGIFPDYRQIIPKEFETTVILLKDDLQNALKLSNIFSDKFNQITLSVKPSEKKLEIYSENKDVGENRTLLEGSLNGKDIDININLKYLLDCFQSISEDSISLNFNGSNRPIIVKGNSDKSFKYLIMPMNR
ncbi:MAG: DNA polymerase III subunit beta [Candidatus Paceibacterota bacterium]